MEIGRLCVKIAGRDSDRICVVADVLDKNFVLIDGNVRRRKCNIMHLEPLDEILKIKKGASHSEVAAEFKKLGLDTWETKAKKRAVRQETKRVSKTKEEKIAVSGKKEIKLAKKEEVKAEKTEAKLAEKKETTKKPAKK